MRRKKERKKWEWINQKAVKIVIIFTMFLDFITSHIYFEKIINIGQPGHVMKDKAANPDQSPQQQRALLSRHPILNLIYLFTFPNF